MFLIVVFFPSHSDVAAQIEHEDMAVMGLIESNEWVETTCSDCNLIASCNLSESVWIAGLL